jgi:protein involved in polysaccharide export with SLBB domain
VGATRENVNKCLQEWRRVAIRMTCTVFAAAGAVGVLFLTPAARAHPMKECRTRYQAAAKPRVRTQCAANARNVFSRRLPPRGITLGIGDVVSVTIFEAEAGGLFVPSEAGARPGNFVTLPEQIVDSNGNITVPYAGTIRAAGRTPTEVQQAIIEALRTTPRKIGS